MFALLRYYGKRPNLTKFVFYKRFYNIALMEYIKNGNASKARKFLTNGKSDKHRTTRDHLEARYRPRYQICGPCCRTWRVTLRARSLGRTESQNRYRGGVMRQDRHTHTHTQALTTYLLRVSVCMWRVHQVHGEKGEKDSAF